MDNATEKKIPGALKPFLWSLRWDDLNTDEDKEDIILATVNEGTLAEWRWLIDVYGKEIVRSVLEKHLETEFHPESGNLAKVVFAVSHFRYAR